MGPREVAHDPHLVHFTLPVGASWTQLIKAQNTFLEILREVSRSIAGTSEDPVEWIVKRVSEGSADIALAPLPKRTISEPALHEMTSAVPAGMAALQRGTDRPEHFTERALRLTATLSTVLPANLPPPRTHNGTGEVEITKAASTHAERILAQPYISEIGTIVGTLDYMNVHDPNKRQFVIYDELTGDRIDCFFGHRIASEVIGSAFERRVSVTGEVRSREWGEIVSVIVARDGFEVLPADNDLPTFDDVLGILAR